MHTQSRLLQMIAISLAVVTQTSFGCATTKVDVARIKQVEKLAIIAFEGKYNVRDPDEGSKSGWTQAANAVADVARDASGKEDGELRSALNHSYDRLVQVVASATDIDVLTREEMVANEAYREEWARLGPTPSYDLTTADGIIGYSHLRYSTPEQRERLVEGLGVDGIAIAYVNWVTGKVDEPNALTSLVTGKDRMIRPAAVVTFTAWRKGEEMPVWEEKGVRGCPTQEGIPDLYGFSLTPDMAPLLAQATDYGYHALVERYQEAVASEDGSAGSVSMKGLLVGGTKCG